MSKKQIQVLSLLAAGIALELILLAGLLTVQGNSERVPSAKPIKIAIGGQKHTASQPAGTATAVPVAGTVPVFGYPYPAPATLGPGEALELTALAPSLSDAEPGGNYSPPEGFDPYGYPPPYMGGYPPPGSSYDDPGGDYTPPTLPAGPTEVLPTDVPADTQTPTATWPAPPPAPTRTPTGPAPTQGGASPTPSRAAPTAAPSATPTRSAAQPGNGLISAPAQKAPALDGAGGDEAWKAAPPITIETKGGANQSATRVTAQSVHDGQNIYFLFSWADPSHSFLLNPWEKGADGSWKMLKTDTGDENTYYEDKLALLWVIKGQPDFAAQGCGGACHTGENPDVKAYGNMYAAQDGLLDLWQWKSVRNTGQVDDQYLNDTRYSPDHPSAGIYADPSTGGMYKANRTNDKKSPAYMPPNGGERNGAPGYILDGEKVALDSGLFKAGERVPAMIVSPFEGDRGEIAAAWRYADGRWTLELRRKLVTGSPYDVQFDDLGKTYRFALATFDNSQLRHAMQDGSVELRFQQ